MDQDETMEETEYTQVAVSQRLRRTLHQVYNRSRRGRAVMWRSRLRQIGEWKETVDADRSADRTDGGGVSQ